MTNSLVVATSDPSSPLTIPATGTGIAVVVAPVINVPGGTYDLPQAVLLSDTTAGATIYYTTNGTTPTANSTVFVPGKPIQLVQAFNNNLPATGTQTFVLTAIAILDGVSSPTSTQTYIIGPSTCAEANYYNFPIPNEFPGNPPYTYPTPAGITLNGGALPIGGALLITGPEVASTVAGDHAIFEATSLFYNTPISTAHFIDDLAIQSGGDADGFTITVQAAGPTEVGRFGGGLGYANIPKSLAIKFDMYDNSGEGSDSTGTFTNGGFPTVPSIDLTPTGIDLHSGHLFTIHLEFTNVITGTITDTVTGVVAPLYYKRNVSQIVGPSAYIGFTGGTGYLYSYIALQSWTVINGSGCGGH